MIRHTRPLVKYTFNLHEYMVQQCSHMTGGVSPVGIVGVCVVLFHIPLLVDASDEEEEHHHDQPSFPEGIVDIVPHLVVQHVDLQQPSDVVSLTW